jgi:hypothetical protein
VVLASTLVTVLIIVGVVALIIVLFLVVGPLTRTEQLREDVGAGEAFRGDLPEEDRAELFEDEGPGITDEGRLDRENE